MRPALAMPSMGEIRQKRYTVGLMDPRPNATPAPERTFLTQDEVRRLFAVITGTRDRALFPLAYHHGLRASEVSLLQRQDIHARQGRIYIPRVQGSVSNMYPLQPEDLRRLRAYLRTREDDSPALFISNRGLPLERRSSWDLMQTYGERAGIVQEKRLFHALRHAIAVHLLDAGADVAFVQDRLGHANIQNTMVYMRYTTVTRDAQMRHLFASHRVV
jgi:type 1 fimbriae regulatory protein FimB